MKNVLQTSQKCTVTITGSLYRTAIVVPGYQGITSAATLEVPSNTTIYFYLYDTVNHSYTGEYTNLTVSINNVTVFKATENTKYFSSMESYSYSWDTNSPFAFTVTADTTIACTVGTSETEDTVAITF